ncbi:MAG: M28 family peptidase [Bacteroidia bacterium]
MKFLISIFIACFPLMILGQNNVPSINILSISNDETAEELTINYEFNDLDGDSCEVWLKSSSDGGIYYELVDLALLTGDFGEGLLSSNQLSVVWDYSSITSEIINQQIQLYVSDNKVIDIAELVNLVEEIELRNSLDMIEGERHYIAAPEHLEVVKSYINERFTDADLQTENHEFMFNNSAMQNVLGRKQGAKNEAITYLIDGHFDGVPGSPAADDNGSAVAGMLEALRILSQYSFEHSIRFIGFDAEELGLIGSQRYVQNGIKAFEDIQGVLNFEMIGYYSDEPNSQTLPNGFDFLFPAATQQVADNQYRGDFISVIGNAPSSSLLEAFALASETYVPELSVLTIPVPGDGSIAPDLRRSDHASFWDGGMKALMLTDGAEFRNLNYHTPADSVGTLNFNFIKNVVKAAVATVAELAVPISASHAEANLSDVLSIEDHHQSFPASFSVYPNPSNGRISLEINNENSSFKSRVEVFNIRGEQVFRKVLNIPSGKSTSTFDFTELPSGSYIINLNSGAASKTGSFVIQ